MGSEEIGLELQDGVAVVTLNRPHKRNALSLANWRRLGEIFQQLSEDAKVRVAILTGADGHFCAGADISEFDKVRADAESGRIYEEATEAATLAIRDWPGPTIAAISGYAMGGGCGLALACDFRVADRSARMGIPAARLGIVYGALDCELLYRQVGLANAKRVLYAGRPFENHDCISMGLIDIPAERNALAAARDLASDLAGNAPISLAGSKFILEAVANGRVGSVQDEITKLVDRSMASEDYREGRRAFLEKRKPAFVGR
jgi:enoyl-CoA hydratase/carnithine racemase